MISAAAPETGSTADPARSLTAARSSRSLSRRALARSRGARGVERWFVIGARHGVPRSPPVAVPPLVEGARDKDNEWLHSFTISLWSLDRHRRRFDWPLYITTCPPRVPKYQNGVIFVNIEGFRPCLSKPSYGAPQWALMVRLMQKERLNFYRATEYKLLSRFLCK